MTTQSISNPGSGNVAIYIRTAAAQENSPARQHSFMTRDDLVILAHQLGFSDEQITIIEEYGVSGKAALEQRPGLQTLLDSIKNGIQAILVADEIRLFRNATELTVSLFLELCKEHNVKVITPQVTYDFSNPRYAQAFRFLCEQGSSMIYARIAQRQRRNTNKQLKETEQG